MTLSPENREKGRDKVSYWAEEEKIRSWHEQKVKDFKYIKEETSIPCETFALITRRCQ